MLQDERAWQPSSDPADNSDDPPASRGQNVRIEPRFALRRAVASDAPALARLNTVVQRLHFEAFPDRFHEPDERRTEPFFRQVLSADGAPNRAWLCVNEVGDAVGYVLALLRERPSNPFTKASRWVELDQIAILDNWRSLGVASTASAATEHTFRTIR